MQIWSEKNIELNNETCNVNVAIDHLVPVNTVNKKTTYPALISSCYILLKHAPG